MKIHKRRVKTLPSDGQSPSSLQRLCSKEGKTLCFQVLLLMEPFHITLDNELEASLIRPGNPLIRFCLLVSGISLIIIKKNQRGGQKALVSAALTTTVPPSLLPAPFLFPLGANHWEWPPVFPIKWDLSLPSKFSSSTSSCSKSCLINSTPYDLFFPFIFWPYFPGHTKLPKELKEMLTLSLVIKSWWHFQLSTTCLVTLFLFPYISVIQSW